MKSILSRRAYTLMLVCNVVLMGYLILRSWYPATRGGMGDVLLLVIICPQVFFTFVSMMSHFDGRN